MEEGLEEGSSYIGISRVEEGVKGIWVGVANESHEKSGEVGEGVMVGRVGHRWECTWGL